MRLLGTGNGGLLGAAGTTLAAGKVLLLAGNFFCMACPFMLPRNLARRFVRPVRNWPRPLRTTAGGAYVVYS